MAAAVTPLASALIVHDATRSTLFALHTSSTTLLVAHCLLSLIVYDATQRAPLVLYGVTRGTPFSLQSSADDMLLTIAAFVVTPLVVCSPSLLTG